MIWMKKKGQVFSQLSGLGVGIATLIIIFAVVFVMLSQTRTQIVAADDVPANWTTDPLVRSTALNATITLTNAAAGVPGWVPLVVIASIGGILISLVSLFRRGA